MTDVDHWGVVEKWSDDCEDYVLLKRRLLMQAGWPREALFITVVCDKKDEGTAVLTVKNDRGDYVPDNQAEDVVLWSDTGYRFEAPVARRWLQRRARGVAYRRQGRPAASEIRRATGAGEVPQRTALRPRTPIISH